MDRACYEAINVYEYQQKRNEEKSQMRCSLLNQNIIGCIIYDCYNYIWDVGGRKNKNE